MLQPDVGEWGVPMIRWVLALTTVWAVCAQAEVRVASMDFSTRGVKTQLGSLYAERFALYLRKQGLTVTTSKDVAAVLSLERQRQLLGCADASSSCMAELVGALGVDVLVTGTLMRVGKGTQVSVKLVNSHSAETLFQVSKLVKEDDEVLDLLESSAADAAPAVKAAFAPVQPPAPEPTKPQVVNEAVPVRPPPASQVVTLVQPQPVGPWVLGGAGAMAVGAGGALLLASVFMVPPTATVDVPPSAHAALSSQAKQFQLIGTVTASVGAAAVIGAIVWGRVGASSAVVPVLTSDGRAATLGLIGHW